MRIFSSALILAIVLASGARAESLTSTFGVRLFGAPVGRMVLAANTNGAAYAARGEFRTTGLVGLLARVHFTMSARGAGFFPRFRPASYSENLDTGYRTSEASVTFDPGDGRIDPLTGLLAALIDRPAEAGCAYTGETYDGTRTMRVQIREQQRTETTLICGGTLTRTRGYSAEDMAQAKGFAFSISYRHGGGKLSVERADVATIHGKVTLVRE